MNHVAVSRLLIALISGFALWNVFGLSVAEWSASGVCPRIAGLPACYVVTGAYLAIFISALISKKPLYIPLFIAGAGVVFGLAVIGSVTQVMGIAECPKTSSGFPLCYISLSIAVLLIGLFVLREKANRRLA
jgi:hypothetical protein